jgi:hypothetical protein
VGQENVHKSCCRDSRERGSSLSECFAWSFDVDIRPGCVMHVRVLLHWFLGFRIRTVLIRVTVQAALSGDRHVTSSPARRSRSHLPPRTRRTGCAQGVLPCSQVAGPAKQKYLFTRIESRSFGSVKLWMKAFNRNPSNSPSQYRRVLRLPNLEAIKAAVSDAFLGSVLQSYRRIASGDLWGGRETSFLHSIVRIFAHP